MKRLNPIGSLLGIALTILLFLGLAFSLFVNRGLAFNPGKLTSTNKDGVVLQGFESHAEFEKQCKNCHEPLKANLATKCLTCHTNVFQQIQENFGVHSQIDSVKDCASCHSEHRGRAYNPTLTAYKLFDHTKASFSLYWHQQNFDTTPMQCIECHTNDNFNHVDNQTCLECHDSKDENFSNSHPQDFGSNCQDCHEGTDRMQQFNHDAFGFPLEYKHAQISCTGCHVKDNFNETPKDCIACHKEPTIHQGLFDQTCDTCHTAENWSTVKLDDKRFNHLDSSGFSLALHQADYANQAITCMTCHPTDIKEFDIQNCVECHKTNDEVFMTDHVDKYGSDCLNCHDGGDRLSNFDHANFFPLDGKHKEIQCSDCHAERVFKGTSSECWQCHKEPEIHSGVFGQECNYCHSTDAWTPAHLEKHAFPLNHGVEAQNSELKCDTCHVTNYIEYTCYNCHEHKIEEILQKHKEENINEQELPACTQCHPTGKGEGE